MFPRKYTFVETKSPKGYQLKRVITKIKIQAVKKPVDQKKEVVKKAKGNLLKTGAKMLSVLMIIGILMLVNAIYEMYRKYITK